MNKVKLTKPQEELLKKAAKKIGVYAVPTYAPLKKLLRLGLVDNGEGGTAPRRSFGGGYWFITDKGREWLGIAVPPEPIMDTCEECQGHGEVQQDCEDCGVALTTENHAADSEGMLCKPCWEKVDDG